MVYHRATTEFVLYAAVSHGCLPRPAGPAGDASVAGSPCGVAEVTYVGAPSDELHDRAINEFESTRPRRACDCRARQGLLVTRASLTAVAAWPRSPTAVCRDRTPQSGATPRSGTGLRRRQPMHVLQVLRC